MQSYVAWRESQGCLRKKPFGSRHQAKEYIKRRKVRLSKGNQYIPGLEPYLCEFCDQWHVGHKHKVKVNA